MGTSGDGKAAYVEGPDELFIEIDTDDVNPETVWPAIERMVAILNETWDCKYCGANHGVRDHGA
jgi:hypothetical protein